MQRKLLPKRPPEKRVQVDKLSPILMGLVATFVVILGVSLIFSCLIFYSPLPETYLLPAALIISIAAMFIGGFVSARKAQTKGLLHGLLVGIFAIIILFVASLFTGNGELSFNLNSIYYLIAAAIGGVMGVK